MRGNRGCISLGIQRGYVCMYVCMFVCMYSEQALSSEIYPQPGERLFLKVLICGFLEVALAFLKSIQNVMLKRSWRKMEDFLLHCLSQHQVFMVPQAVYLQLVKYLGKDIQKHVFMNLALAWTLSVLYFIFLLF